MQRTPRRAEADAKVIERARTDRDAFGELYDLYLNRVYAFCWSYSTTKEQAEDLTAQTFERALNAIARYQDRGVPFSAWLLRIAANLARDRASRPIKEVQGDEDAPFEEREDTSELNPETQVEQWERAATVQALLATLPPDQQQVVRLRFWEDRPWLEVGTLMGRSEDAVKQLARRALKAMAAKLDGDRRTDS